jgi:predicted acylesterase/phospholipase RssA
MDYEPAALTDTSAYAAPTLDCDIVMKGGITSGVVYPLAVCEIARTYRLRGIGGTSAGAIAAAVAAAAEVGRDSASGGFGRLARLPKWLGDPSDQAAGTNLLNMFQPSQGTRPLFRVLTAGLGLRNHPAKRVRRLIAAAVRGFPGWALLGALPGLAILTLAIFLIVDRSDRDALLTSTLVLAAAGGFVLAVVLGLGAVAWRLARGATTRIPANRFGLCNGMSGDPGRGPQALTEWLTDELDGLAGKTAPASPLTFGDLQDRGVGLRMMTTSLTHGTPYALPFGTGIFFYDPQEFRELFPRRVVDWMERHPRATANRDQRAEWDRQLPRRPLPEPRDLPVVVAVRMSLSFPFLISAVPLWAVDYTSPSRDLRPCWFSDGGIASNFPVHFFDRPLPEWPTFAINLGPFRHGEEPDPDERRNTFMADANSHGALPRWTEVDGLGGFLGALLDTMQNWRDNAQIRLPGYRDRVVLVKHTKDEGGMNLDMDPPAIGRLSVRGFHSGVRLVERFARPPATPGALSWDNHRWIRYRLTMAGLEESLEQMLRGYRTPPQGGGPSYAELVRRGRRAPPASYRFRNLREKAFAIRVTDGLEELALRWTMDPDSFIPGAPKPTPELRLTPVL